MELISQPLHYFPFMTYFERKRHNILTNFMSIYFSASRPPKTPPGNMYTVFRIRGQEIFLLTVLIFRWPQRWRSHIRICSVIACDTSASAWLLEFTSWPGLLLNQRWTSSSERLTSEASEHLFVMPTSVGHGYWLQTFKIASHHRDAYCRPDQCVSSNSKISSLFRLNFRDQSYSQCSRLLGEANEQWFNVLGLARRLLWQLLHLHQERRTWKPIAKS